MKQSYFIVLVTLIAVLPGLFLSGGCSSPEPVNNTKAAIIDQLYNLNPNPSFSNEATAMLKGYGFEVDLYKGDEVTVDFYRKLPSLRYKLLIFRVHSGFLYVEGELLKRTWLFTNEGYSEMKYTAEQLTQKLAKARIDATQPYVFAIGSKFITDSMEGQFNSTVAIMMGCNCLEVGDMVKAFVEEGASSYLGWNGKVTLDYVEASTLNLLHNLTVQDMTVADAVVKTMTETGYDPVYRARLLYYPDESTNKTLRQLIK